MSLTAPQVAASYVERGWVSVVTPPTVEPVSLAEARDHLRLSVTDDDLRVAALITAAREGLEARAGLACLSRTLDITYDGVPRVGAPLVLPVGPAQSITSVTAYSAAGAGSTVSSAVYRLEAPAPPAPPRLVLKENQAWPTDLRPTSALVVRAVVGFGSSVVAIPAPIRQAILLSIQALYDGSDETLSRAIAALVAPYRIAVGFA